MMSILFLGYSKCSTCSKARKWLEKNQVEFENRDIKEANPNAVELTMWYHHSGLPLKNFFNTSGKLYKEMKLKDKLLDMSEKEQIRLLATNGMLIKRPMIVGEDFVLVGFKEKEWEEKLGGF